MTGKNLAWVENALVLSGWSSDQPLSEGVAYAAIFSSGFPVLASLWK